MKGKRMSESLMTVATAEAVAMESVRCRVLPDGRMDRENAAAYLGVKPKTLSMWALLGKGPRFVKVGGRVFYYRPELDLFIGGQSA
jgi:hypothetical protein